MSPHLIRTIDVWLGGDIWSVSICLVKCTNPLAVGTGKRVRPMRPHSTIDYHLTRYVPDLRCVLIGKNYRPIDSKSVPITDYMQSRGKLKLHPRMNMRMTPPMG